MRIKMGTVVPKMGTTVHLAADQARYREAVAAALRAELGPTHQAIKTAMRWTGASERTVKNWFAGAYGPSGEHLIELLRHSDDVLQAVLQLSGRENVIVAAQIKNAELVIEELLASIRRIQIN